MAIKYYELSIKELERLAKKKDAEAAYFLGMVYRKQNDVDNAIKYLTICYKAKHGKGTYQLGLIRYLRREYKEAHKLFEAALDFGENSSYTYFYLGKMFENGEGVKQDLKRAYDCYTIAMSGDDEDDKGAIEAKEARDKMDFPKKSNTSVNYSELSTEELEKLYAKGDYKVCFELGKRYDDDKNYQKAFEVLSKGADKIKDIDCLNKIGIYYFNGAYVKQNYETAFSYFSYAARKDHFWAMYNLAYCFENGFGTEENIYMAMDWYKRAADVGNEDALEKYKALQEEYANEERPDPTDTIEVRLFEEESDNDEESSEEEQLERKALDGDFIACRDLITIYFENKEYDKSFKFAKRIYREMGHDIYAFFIGIHYYHGHGVDQDYEKAYNLILKASAEQSKYRYGGPAFYLARFYKYGRCVKPSPHLAFSFYKRAANYHFIAAYVPLAKCYENGEGVDKDINKAIEWYKKAAEEGNEQAIKRLKDLGIK